MCSICSKKANYLQVELDCGHKCCYLCLKAICTKNIVNNYIKCLSCDTITYKNINNIHTVVPISRRVVWLYSARQIGIWWCYDEITSKKLDAIFNDYEKRNIVLNKTKNKIKTGCQIYSGNYACQTNSPTTNTNFINNTFDPVEFDSDDADSEEESSEDLEYNIDISGTKYYINFQQNIQINLDDSNKKRDIKKIVIPDVIPQQDIVTYLKSQNVIGIAGLKFD